MPENLRTTNVLLGIMASVSVIELLLLIGAGVALWITFKRLLAVSERAIALADTLASRDLLPVIARVNAVLDDVKDLSAVAKRDAEWVDSTVRSTVDRIETVAESVRSNFGGRTQWGGAVLRGLRFAISAIASARRS